MIGSHKRRDGGGELDGGGPSEGRGDASWDESNSVRQIPHTRQLSKAQIPQRT